MPENQLVKSGEIVFTVQCQRTKAGVKFTIKTTKDVEDLISSWGNGETVPVNEYGRDWKALKGAAPLRVYHLNKNPGNQVIGDLVYNITQIGRQMNDGTMVNLSWLRLVGISEGVSFEINGVHSLEGLTKVINDFKTCVRHFYQQYLLPIELSLLVQTQEARL